MRPQIDAGVTVDGFVHRPGPVAWREGMRLTDVLGSTDELKPNADQQYILVRREFGSDRRVSVVSADLTRRGGGPRAARTSRSPRADHRRIGELAPGRERIIKPVIEELRLQAGVSRPTEVVRVEGRVKCRVNIRSRPA